MVYCSSFSDRMQKIHLSLSCSLFSLLDSSIEVILHHHVSCHLCFSFSPPILFCCSSAPQKQNSIHSSELQQNSIHDAKLKQNSIHGAELKQNSIHGAELKQNSIHGAELKQRRQEKEMMKNKFYALYLTRKKPDVKRLIFCFLYEKEDKILIKQVD